MNEINIEHVYIGRKNRIVYHAIQSGSELVKKSRNFCVL